MFVLTRWPLGSFIDLPFPLPLNIAIHSVFAAIFGPLAGLLIGFISQFFMVITNSILWGIAIDDIFWRWPTWWHALIFVSLFGLAIGYFRKHYPIEQGTFGIKQMAMFNVVQIAAYLVFYPIRIMILGVTPNWTFFTSASVALIILGTLLLFAYSKIRASGGGRQP